MLSIIIPCRNRKEMLQQLIDSIPDADEIEVIVIDDHSDNVIKPYVNWKRASFRIIQNRINQRYAGSARNYGIEMSRGKYIFFADSDDLLVSENFKHCLKLITKSSADVIFTKCTSFGNHGESADRHTRYNWLVDRYLKDRDPGIFVRFFPPWCKFIKREFINQNRLSFEETRVSNDIHFSASLIIARPIIDVCEMVSYSIRAGNSNLTNDYSLDSLITRLSSLYHYNTLLRNNKLSYLMVPGIRWLFKLYKLNTKLFLQWLLLFIQDGQPVFFKIWSVKNYLKRVIALHQR
jgi:glycosyltransferase involved in cell wall biosynthesis